MDAQSVQASGNVPESSQGIDAAKKIKGRKHHLVTDTLGLVLAVIVTAASVHDSASGKELLQHLAASHPGVTKVWAEGATRPLSSTTEPAWASTSKSSSEPPPPGSNPSRSVG
ncbi:transposase [Streptomyces sp. NBC_00162]|nr:transposase [Streptomyces sp. NBC_00162]